MKWKSAAGNRSARSVWLAAVVLACVVAVVAVVAIRQHEDRNGSSPATGADPAQLGASTTGLKLVTGAMTIDRDGEQATDLHVTGSLYITGSNVSVDNVDVDGDIFINQSASGALRSPVPRNIRLSHVDAQTIWSNGFDNLSISRARFQASENSPNAQLFSYRDDSKQIDYPASGLLITDSAFLGVQSSTDGAHLENIHLGGVQGAKLEHNIFSITAPPGSATLADITANVVLEPALYGTPNRNVTLVGNRFSGGGYYQLYFVAAGSAEVSGNAFSSTGPNFKAVQYPPTAYSTAQLAGARSYLPFKQQGNTLDGRPTTLPGGL